MNTRIGIQLKAWGEKPLPRVISAGSGVYRYVRTFKHDFFAATALYELESGPEKDPLPRNVVLKLQRKEDFLGFPLAWLGRALCSHEKGILRRLSGLDQVPRLLGSLGKEGLVYEYIPGCSLDEKPDLPPDFFLRFTQLVQQIHDRDIAYVDLNKKGNILLGSDGRPYLIDFQISFDGQGHLRPCRRWCGRILSILQREDLYHIKKHQRRSQRRRMNPEQTKESLQKSRWIRLHRMIADPFRQLRRWFLRWMYKRGSLILENNLLSTSENDPRRWER